MPTFDPSAAAAPDSGIFGLPEDPEGARVHVIGVPFDATTSFRKGTAAGPAAILAASRQVDLFDLVTGRPYEAGIWMAPLDRRVGEWNDEASRLAQPVIERGGAGGDPELERAVRAVDAIQEKLNAWVEERAVEILERGKLCALVGGDHSVPFGSIRAHAERFPDLGILHFDAHADLRAAYEGFTWSHASILYNVVTRLEAVERVVQVGIRDLSEAEHALIAGSRGRVTRSSPPACAKISATGVAGKSASPACARTSPVSVVADDELRQRSTRASRKPSSPTDFCHFSVKLAEAGMQVFGSSSKRMRTGSVTPSPKAMASRWPSAVRNSSSPEPVSAMADLTISWSRSLDMRSANTVLHWERIVGSISAGRCVTMQSEAPYLRPSLAILAMARLHGSKPICGLSGT